MTQNQNFFILGDKEVRSVKKSKNGVRNSTMFFESKMCVAWSYKLKDAKFKLQVHFLWFDYSHEIVWFQTEGALILNLFSFKLQAHFFLLDLHH